MFHKAVRILVSFKFIKLRIENIEIIIAAVTNQVGFFPSLTFDYTLTEAPIFRQNYLETRHAVGGFPIISRGEYFNEGLKKYLLNAGNIPAHK